MRIHFFVLVALGVVPAAGGQELPARAAQGSHASIRKLRQEQVGDWVQLLKWCRSAKMRAAARETLGFLMEREPGNAEARKEWKEIRKLASDPPPAETTEATFRKKLKETAARDGDRALKTAKALLGKGDAWAAGFLVREILRTAPEHAAAKEWKAANEAKLAPAEKQREELLAKAKGKAATLDATEFGVAYSLALPSDFDGSKSYPVVAWISDRDSNGEKDIEMLRPVLGESCILLCPTIPWQEVVGGGGAREEMYATVRNHADKLAPLMDRAAFAFGNPSQIFAGGHGIGAAAGYDLIAKIPWYFAGFHGIYPDILDDQKFAPSREGAALPILILKAERDEQAAFIDENVGRARERLEKAGYQGIQLKTVPAAGHRDTAKAAGEFLRPWMTDILTAGAE